MAGGRSEEEGGCRVCFHIEWAMWGNMNALYAAASKERKRERQRQRQKKSEGKKEGSSGIRVYMVCMYVCCVLGDIFV